MLTSIYYYRYYRPYMLRTLEPTGAVAPKLAPIAKKPDLEPNASFLLNKSMKVDVISHARQTSASINGVKDGARRVSQKMEGFNQRAYRYGLPDARAAVSAQLAGFADSFNKSVEFMSGQTHSTSLNNFADDLTALALHGRRQLEYVDIFTENGRSLIFAEEDFLKKDEDALNIAFGHSIEIFLRTYRDSTAMLNMPLTEHMNFQNLSYFYNYRMGTLVDETFKLIESGNAMNIANLDLIPPDTIMTYKLIPSSGTSTTLSLLCASPGTLFLLK